MKDETDCTLSVPAETLATHDYSRPVSPGKDGEAKEPEKILPMVGDPVEFRVRGSVTAIANGVATVRVAFINDARPAMPGPVDEDAEMQAAAKAEDDEAEEEI